MRKRLGIVLCAFMALVLVAPVAHGTDYQNALSLLGYFNQNGKEHYYYCSATVAAGGNINNGSASFSATSFFGQNDCHNEDGADISETYQTGNACLEDASNFAILGCGPGYSEYTMSTPDDGGTVNKGLLEPVRVYYDYSIQLPGNASGQNWESYSDNAYEGCSSGLAPSGNSSISCYLQGLPEDYTADVPTQYLDNAAISYADYAIGTTFSLLGYAEGEALCSAGQVSTPQPSSDPICNDVGVAVGDATYYVGDAEYYANYAINTASSLVTQEQGDANCAASQVVGSPQSPGGNQTLCQDTVYGIGQAKYYEQLAVSTVNGLVGTAEQLVSQEQGDANCVAGQAGGSPPRPGSNQPLCQATAGPMASVKQAVANEQGDANCAASQVVGSPQSPGGNQTLCQDTVYGIGQAKYYEQLGLSTANGLVGTAEQLVSQEQGDANCVAGQAGGSPPRPGSNQPLCQATAGPMASVKQAVAAAGQLVDQELGDVGCVAGQAGGSPPAPGSGQPLCGVVAPVVSQVKGAGQVANEPPAGQYSSTCTSPAATVADGYAANGTYVTLRAQPSSSNASQEWVCYRVSNPNSGSDIGGRVTVGGVSPSAGLPSHDGSASACQLNSETNQVPPPHPLVQGTVVGQSVMLDTYDGSAAPGQLWVCLSAGGVSQRVIVPVAGVGGSPTVFNQLDASPPSLPSPNADPYPSGTCQNATTGKTMQLVNGSSSGENVWLYEWQSPDGKTVDLCARAQGAGAAGAVVSVSSEGVPGVTPVVGPASSSACGFSVFQIFTPPQAASSMSISQPGPPAANPAAVCLSVGSTSYDYQVGVTGSAQPPTVSWTFDPDTP